MEALLTLIFSNISKFLNYLNINPRLQNKIFTVVSVFPTLYILRIVKGYFQNGNHLRGIIYLLIFIVLMYFIVVNFLYYFKERKVKWDVTNLIEDIVPEDTTFGGSVPTNSLETPSIKGQKIKLNLSEDSDIIIEEVVDKLVTTGEIKLNSLEQEGYLLDKYTLIPYYKIRKETLWIGSSYKDMKPVASIVQLDDRDELIPLGVFLIGGPYREGPITYKEPFRLQLRVKDREGRVS